MQPDSRKAFGPIRDAYAFFQQHATETEADIRAYWPHLLAVTTGDQPIRMLDFGCGGGVQQGRRALRTRLSGCGRTPLDHHAVPAGQRLPRPLAARAVGPVRSVCTERADRDAPGARALYSTEIGGRDAADLQTRSSRGSSLLHHLTEEGLKNRKKTLTASLRACVRRCCSLTPPHEWIRDTAGSLRALAPQIAAHDTNPSAVASSSRNLLTC